MIGFMGVTRNLSGVLRRITNDLVIPMTMSRKRTPLLNRRFNSRTFTGVVPLHFYGELTKTAEGCKILEEKGHFDEFTQCIYTCKNEEEDTEVILKLKSCLWAVGNVGANDGGVPFLAKSGIVKEIVSIAEQSNVISLKGYALPSV
jgi:Rapamycin-insensitive companion of mTOR, domain 5